MDYITPDEARQMNDNSNWEAAQKAQRMAKSLEQRVSTLESQVAMLTTQVLQLQNRG